MIYKCLPGNHGSCQNRPARGALPSRPNQSPAVTATASCVVTAGLVTPASSSRHAIPSVPASRATSPPLAKQVSLEFLSSTTCSAPPINPSTSSNSASPSPSFFYQRCPVNLGIQRRLWAPHWITLSKGLLSFQLGPLCLLLKLLFSITSPRVLEMSALS